ncbi:ornithine decarboxylase isozyme [Chlorella sorokiniana]|uniref:Ornithine decarboxylase isozyme n=1 Tax=Chlorella sorokiniana TaxID=3076 RepID=A0A2P6TET4_CHLSO|nr:ornithine decarboxylase isozyme [Chlorella sorokiniana]|eukprot:PRW32478.1 ornithine decarboxylase isozyme [Chlorella sorokiniana]
MSIATCQTTGAALLALLLCSQLATFASANASTASQQVSTEGAMNRGRITDHIDLLNALDALSRGNQPSSTRKPPTAAGGGGKVSPASVPASLAASLAYWKKAVPPIIGGSGLTWQAVPAAHVAGIHADSLKLASFYSQPPTVALLKANPTVVPPGLRKPEGMTRSAACKQVLKMQLSGKVADWHAGIRPRKNLPGISGRMPVNANTPFKRGPRRSLNAQCSGFESFLNVLLGDGRDYFCVDVSCEFQIPDLPLFITIGGTGCLGVLKVAADSVFYCMEKGCNPVDITDERVLYNLIPSISTQTKVALYAGLCLGIEGIEKILKKIGMSVCVGPAFTLYPLASQFQATFGFSLLFAGVELGGRVQLAPGSGNPLCTSVQQKNPRAYNRVLKCVDFCAWGSGNGAFEFGAWLNLLFFRKTWSIPIVQTPVPECDK